MKRILTALAFLVFIGTHTPSVTAHGQQCNCSSLTTGSILLSGSSMTSIVLDSTGTFYGSTSFVPSSYMWAAINYAGRRNYWNFMQGDSVRYASWYDYDSTRKNLWRYASGISSSMGSVTSVTAGTGLSGGTITTSGTISMPNVGTAGTGDIVTTDAQGRVTALYNRGINAVTRPINSTSYTPSTTQMAYLSYTISISCTATIGGASSGSVELQYYNGSSWVAIGKLANSNTVTLAIVLNSITVQTAVLSGYVPANASCRMVSASSGTTTITYVSGFETY